MHTLHWIDFAASFDSVVVVVVEESVREREKERERQYPRRKSAQQVQFVLDNTHRERERERERERGTHSACFHRRLSPSSRALFPSLSPIFAVSASHNEVVVVVVVQKKSSRPSFEKSVEYVNALSFL